MYFSNTRALTGRVCYSGLHFENALIFDPLQFDALDLAMLMWSAVAAAFPFAILTIGTKCLPAKMPGEGFRQSCIRFASWVYVIS